MVKRVAVIGTVAVLGVFVAVGGTALAHDRDGHPLWASPWGGAGSCRHEAPCSLSNAVSSASSGDTVIRGNRIFDDKIGIWTIGVDPATTTIAHNLFGPGVTPISVN